MAHTENFADAFDCFVINLARHPERLARFRAANQWCGMRIERLEAVDGRAVDKDVVERIMAPGAKLYTPGAIGCALSHLALWRRAIATGKPHVVFEDDAVLRRDFTAQLPHVVAPLGAWDFVLCGYNTDSFLQIELAPDISFAGTFSVAHPTPAQLENFAASREPVTAFRLAMAFGSCGYAISPAGAAKLSALCLPMDNRRIWLPTAGRAVRAHGLDTMMLTVYREIDAYVCFTPLVMTANDRSMSATRGLSEDGIQESPRA